MAAELRALTIRQPWATWITLGAKTVENRTWPTRHRGPLAIHAGAAFEEDAWRTSVVRALPRGTLPGLTSLPKSAILAVVELAGCHEYKPGCCGTPWAEKGAGTWHWVLADVRALSEPVECTGRLGLWRVLPPLAERVLAQLEAVSDAAL